MRDMHIKFLKISLFVQKLTRKHTKHGQLMEAALAVSRAALQVVAELVL
jgi:hypothetical protein